MNESIRFELREGVAVIQLDDQKANALTTESLAALSDALARAKDEANAVVLVGRPGRFSAGFDLKVMKSSTEAATALVKAGCEFFMNLYAHPQPVVAACTGHAVAGGAALLLSSDYRVGTEGDFVIGFNEVAIGLRMPLFISGLARQRLVLTSFCGATLLAQMFSPAQAAAAGFLDEVASPDEVVAKSIAKAKALGALPADAYAYAKRSLRGPFIADIQATLDADLTRVFAGGAL